MGDGFSVKDRLRFAFARARGTPIETDLGPYRAIARAVAEIEASALSDAEIAARSLALRSAARGDEGSKGDGSPGLGGAGLSEALALAAEACRRRLGLRPFEAQLVAAAALCSGVVVQMQTGEGKTLAAALAACCGALDGRGFHVITANDYLARRDAEWMRPIYGAFGLSVASIGGDSSPAERRAAYLSDVTYLTARELGFDYLRDGLVSSASDIAQRPFSRAIVDEADFVLVDEARVPLVIAGACPGVAGDEATDADPRVMDGIARELRVGLDYRVDPEGRTVAITLEGLEHAALLLGRDEAESLGESGEPSDRAKARLFAALHARSLLNRDIDYVVKGGEVRLVDSFTGRVAERRQWPWGIQAAIEAKEDLSIKPEGRIYGSIAVQHLMGLYPRLSAMTATAVSAAQEFDEVYGMATILIPPEKPSCRIDMPDALYRESRSKLRAVIEEIARAHAIGRPVLVGTTTIRESEELAAALEQKGLACVVLNAKNDEAEAALVARAGELGAVTISTDMAGRGTDIKLGEDPRVREAGGLYVIGSGRRESRRLDDQLRGRAGRQGDPGQSRFFVSLEDELFRKYGVADFLPKDYRPVPSSLGGPIEDPACLREVDRAQRLIQGQNSKIRLALRKRSLIVEYDRRCIRAMRDEALLEGRLPEAAEAALAEALATAPSTAGIADAIAAEARRAAVDAFLSRLDSAWADHLALVEDVKEGLGLLRYGGIDPSREYLSTVAGAFERALSDLEEAAAEDCLSIASSLIEAAQAGHPRPERLGAPPPIRRLPDRPSSTWTYAVEDDELPGLGTLSLSPADALLLGPLMLPLMLVGRAVDRSNFTRRLKGHIMDGRGKA